MLVDTVTVGEALMISVVALFILCNEIR